MHVHVLCNCIYVDCSNRIVLDAGYFLDNRSFFENFFTISVYAVIVRTTLHCYCCHVCMSCLQGTLWNAFALGMLMLLLMP